jgi:predicted acyltransferase
MMVDRMNAQSETTRLPTVPAIGGPASQRLMSLDALRGFDMFWIVGADALGEALANFKGGPITKLAAEQLEHAPWEGFHFYDLIFPLFVFMIGVAITFSLGRLIATEGRTAALKRVLRRAVPLYVLGLFYYGGLNGHIDHIRLLGVLQRLALCYLFAGILFIYLRPRGLMAVCLALLLGYWALLTFVPVPEFGAGDFAERHNLTNWLDRMYLPWRKWDGDHDPEGLLSTLPAIASCLLGVFAGLLLRDPARSERQKVAWLAGAGAALVALGYAWGLEFPIIKKIWTSSFVLVAGGFSALLLAAFYLVIDVWKLRMWAMPLVWIGANALAIYIISNVVDFGKLSDRFAGGDVAKWLNSQRQGLGGLVLALVSIALCMAICRFLYRRQIFLRL